MWARIEIVPSDERVVYLPSTTAAEYKKSVNVIFGSKLVKARVEYCTPSGEGQGNSYEEPAVIKITSKLKSSIFLPEDLVYRVKLQKSRITIGPVIGLLLGNHNHVYNPVHMEKYSDRFGIYQRVGGLIYAFSATTVNWKKKIAYGLYYNINRGAWEYGCFPLPDVIYRRDFHSGSDVVRKLRRATGNRLFNSYRFTKYELYRIISESDSLRAFLPPTELTANFNQVKQFIDSYGKVILKPVDLSRGRGICVIEKQALMYRVIDYRSRNVAETMLYEDQLETFFMTNKNLFDKYLIQKYISLARVDGSLFDIRVVMQKTSKHCWQCSGIECRVAGYDSHLTNISRGGYALHLSDALERAFPDSNTQELEKRIVDFCHEFCIYMDGIGHHFAEFGMDIAVDIEKNLWLIEANVFPSFKGFKQIDYDTYLTIRYTPLLYALSLTGLDSDDLLKGEI